jgi:hypothetical protein
MIVEGNHEHAYAIAAEAKIFFNPVCAPRSRATTAQ